MFNAVGGEVIYTAEAVVVTDSESAGARQRKSGEFEAELTIRGEVATDLNPHLTPFFIFETFTVATVEIFFTGLFGTPDLFRNVLVDRFRKSHGDMNQPNAFEFHGYTSNYTEGW